MTADSADQSDGSPDPAEDVLDEPVEASEGASFPIVGVGASAGGLEAFTQLLKALPADTGMAFVLVQHLAPSHPSALAEILGRATKMPVLEVTGEPTVEPNHVYVIPPDRSMIIAGGVLQLLPREGRGAHHPVDQFFRALAKEQRFRAIGVVLSGTATDGTIGLEEIKAEGGITFAQDSSAQHEGMPHSAIASGCVDFVLPPVEIAREIVRIGQHPYAVPEAVARETEIKPNLTQVVQLLHHATGVDFTGYKFNTLYRRVTRRMVFRKMDSLTEYVEYLRKTPAEVDALYQDILISVTSFFRDKESFEALKKTVFPRLLQDRSRHDPVRLWTLGCSTGQEAYSLAMAFMEVAEAVGSSAPLQLFASDLNAAGIEKARAGVYPKDISQDVSPERLKRFFLEVDGQYRIAKTIRDACVFSRHNVLSDPPFSRIDLISCRNLLIYMEPVLQQQIMPTLHYALKPAGCLWLGGAETIGGYRNLFEAEDAKHKIYCKKPSLLRVYGHFPLLRDTEPRVPFTPKPSRAEGVADLPREADRILLTKFAPPGVLVTAELDILQYRGDTSPYLAPAPGKASMSLLKMLREGLLVGVRAAILRAGKERATVREEGLRVKSSGGYHEVAVEVIPVARSGDRASVAKDGGFLVLFEEVGRIGLQPAPEPRQAGSLPHEEHSSDPDTARIEQELASTREYLQAVIEQQEAANEELQSANEEVQSANEELQSTNEELETSKEEIQSSNEELATVNDELNNRNAEVGRVNNDLVNLIGSVQMAIVMLGSDLRIRRFTPTAGKLLNLVPTDVGRPLTEIKLNLEGLSDLEPLLAEVLDTVTVHDREVQDKHGRWHSLRLRPYKMENKIDGVVMMLVDIDSLKLAHAYTQSIVATVREPLLVLDADLRVRTASASFYQTYLVTPEETIERHFYELGNGQWDIPELRRMLEEILPKHNQVDDFEVQCQFERIGSRTVRLNACQLVQASQHDPLILLAMEDVTEQRRQENELKQFAADLSESDRRKTEFLAMLAHELRNPLAPIRNSVQILRLTGGDGEAVQSASAMMERQVNQMVRLVDDLLDVSRISRGKIELRRGRIELASCVHHAVEAARSLHQSMNHELTVTMPPRPIYLDADPARLSQVVGNLLNNACKFTDKGGQIWLTVDHEEDQAVIRVRDNGIGIAADQMPRIFEMFMQVDTSLERSVSGLGIGLTLVKSLVEMHGGTVGVHSDGAGQGSEFSVHLPIAANSHQPQVSQPTATEGATITSRRILVVDDNKDSATTLVMLLKLTGNETQTAYDGLEAVEAAEKFRPDVILLDIGLPKLNGYEVCRRIREQPWGRDIVLVALTGWGQDEDRQKSQEVGFNGHMVKPVDLNALMKLLARLLPVPL